MQKTSNFYLKKPEPDDYIQVEDFNDNSEIIDKELKKISDALKVLNTNGVNLSELLKKKADLGSDNKVKKEQLPELDEYKEILMYEKRGQFPSKGDNKKLYLDKSTNELYRYQEKYILLNEKLKIGITEGTAFDGKRGKDLEDSLKNYYRKNEVDELIKKLKVELSSNIIEQILLLS